MVSLGPILHTTPLPVGKVIPLLVKDVATAGSWEVRFQLDSETVLISLWLGSLASGTFSVNVYTATTSLLDNGSPGAETLILSFPALSGPSGELLLRKAAVALSTVIVRVVATGPAIFDLRAKGVSSGAASVKIEGAGSWTVSQTTVGTTPAEIVPATLTDRTGLVFKNFSANFLYVAESAIKATLTGGYPLGPGESLAFDLTAGQAIWGRADTGTIDVRVAQNGEI